MERALRLGLREHEGLHPKVQSARLQTTGRRSLIVGWSLGDQVFEGEASPLPGFGDDSFERASGELQNYPTERLLAALDSLSHRETLPVDLGAVGAGVGSPSARFALEQCLLGALSSTRSLPIRSLLASALGRKPPSLASFLPASALVDPLAVDATRELARLAQQGVQTIKIKVGRDLATERAFLRGLARSGFRVRLDPNQSLEPADLEPLLEALAGVALEFVEDPSQNLADWRPLSSRVPLAVDEPLSSQTPSSEFLARLGVHFAVLKPMALGGYSACLAWAQVAFELGVRPIVSHLLDGPMALHAALELAFAVQDGSFAPGLGLHPGLEAWPREGWPELTLSTLAGHLTPPPIGGFLPPTRSAGRVR